MPICQGQGIFAMAYEPVVRGETPEEAVQRYLCLPSDSPLIEFKGLEIAIIMSGGLIESALIEPIAFVLNGVNFGDNISRYRIAGWITRKQHNNGNFNNIFPMELSMYSWWCYIESKTGEALRDWNYIEKRKKAQGRDGFSSDHDWEVGFLELGENKSQ